MSWSKVEVDVRVFYPPRVILFKLVNTEVVEHELQLFVGMLSDQHVEKAQELVPAFARQTVCGNSPGRNIQSSKEMSRTISFVFVREPGQGFAVRHFELPLLPLECVNAGLLIDGKPP